jgi:hypothetical protein
VALAKFQTEASVKQEALPVQEDVALATFQTEASVEQEALQVQEDVALASVQIIGPPEGDQSSAVATSSSTDNNVLSPAVLISSQTKSAGRTPNNSVSVTPSDFMRSRPCAESFNSMYDVSNTEYLGPPRADTSAQSLDSLVNATVSAPVSSEVSIEGSTSARLASTEVEQSPEQGTLSSTQSVEPVGVTTPALPSFPYEERIPSPVRADRALRLMTSESTAAIPELEEDNIEVNDGFIDIEEVFGLFDSLRVSEASNASPIPSPLPEHLAAESAPVATPESERSQELDNGNSSDDSIPPSGYCGHHGESHRPEVARTEVFSTVSGESSSEDSVAGLSRSSRGLSVFQRGGGCHRCVPLQKENEELKSIVRKLKASGKQYRDQVKALEAGRQCDSDRNAALEAEAAQLRATRTERIREKVIREAAKKAEEEKRQPN